MATSLHPTVLWAQRKDKIFVTIDVQDCKVRIEPTLHALDRRVRPPGARILPILTSHRTRPMQHPKITVDNDDAAKTGKLTFRGLAHSHATGVYRA